MGEDQLNQLLRDMASNEMEHKSFRRRLDDHDQALKEQSKILVAMERQSAAIENMGKAIGQLDQTIRGMDARVADLEKEPADKWKRISFEIIKYIVLAAIGVAVGYIIKT